MSLQQEIHRQQRRLDEVLELVEDSVTSKNKASFEDLRPVFHRNYQHLSALMMAGVRTMTDEEVKLMDSYASRYGELRNRLYGV